MLVDVSRAQEIVQDLLDKLDMAYQEVAEYEIRVSELEDENHALKRMVNMAVSDRTFVPDPVDEPQDVA